MMPMGMKRKPLSMMIALGAPKGSSKSDQADEKDETSGSEEEEGYEPDDAELASCQDVIDAMAKRNPKALSLALHHWMELAGYGKQSEEE